MFLGTFFTWSATDTESVLSTAKSFITDATPLLIILISIAVVCTILWVIVGILSGHGVWGDKP